MCENVNLPSRAPVVASPEGLTGNTTEVHKMDEICKQCPVQLMLRQRRYISINNWDNILQNCNTDQSSNDGCGQMSKIEVETTYLHMFTTHWSHDSS